MAMKFELSANPLPLVIRTRSNSLPLFSGFRLLQSAVYEPVFNSKKQVTRPIATIFVLSLIA